MSTLETAFTAWLAFLSSLSVDGGVVLNPAASVAEIEALEIAIGYELPEELKALYRITNGQQSPYHVDPKEGQYAVNLFGHYDFLTIDQALSSYEFQLEIREEYGAEMDDYITVREGDFVDRVSWQKGWFPIAGSDANQIAVDLAPPRGGTYGQLVNFGPDDDERAVLSTSISEFFITATNNTANDECALEYGVPDTSDSHVPEEHRVKLNGYILYINAEWNYPFYQDNCVEEPVYEQPEYLNESNAVNARFIVWLAAQSIAEERINQLSNMSSLALSDIMRSRSADGVNELAPDWFVPGGAIPIEIYEEEGFPKNEFPDGIIPLDFVMPAIDQNTYLHSLGFRLACQKATENTGPDVLTIDEYRLFHRYLTLEGIWTEQDYELAEVTMRDLPEVESSGTAASGSYGCSSISFK